MSSGRTWHSQTQSPDTPHTNKTNKLSTQPLVPFNPKKIYQTTLWINPLHVLLRAFSFSHVEGPLGKSLQPHCKNAYLYKASIPFLDVQGIHNNFFNTKSFFLFISRRTLIFTLKQPKPKLIRNLWQYLT